MDEVGADAIVVRAGSARTAEVVQKQVELAIEDGYGPVLSVCAAHPRPGETADDLVARICRDAAFPHSRVQLSTAEVVREAGFALESDVQPGDHESHHNVVFPTGPDLEWCEKFVQCFGEAFPNPGRAR